MSGPAALNAVRSNNKTEYHKKLGFSTTNRIVITEEYYGTAEPELSLFLQSKILSTKYYKKGSIVYKTSKYKTSSNYTNLKDFNGRRELLPNKKIKDLRQQSEQLKWILCDKRILPKSRNRKIIHIQPQEKHEILKPQPTRRWPTAVLSTFTTITRNYYEPLIPFAHYEEIEMARDKAKSSGATRNRMINLRSGEPPTAAPPAPSVTSRQPMFGRGGGRGGGRAGESRRERQTVHLSNLVKDQEKQREQNMASTTTIATGSTATSTMKTQTSNITDDDGRTPTISDLTEPTNIDEEDMEEEVDMLQPVLKQAVPSEIKKFIPNSKWTEEMQQNLPKKRYGVEIKITLENTPKENTQPPDYHHPRIFKAVATAILTAALQVRQSAA
jgi:hypothetical protein